MANRSSFKKFTPVIFLLLFIVKTIYAGTPGKIISDDLELLFNEGLGSVAEEAVVLFPLVKKDLENTFGWKINFKPTLILIQDRETFQGMVDSKLIVAFAIPSRDLIVIDYSKIISEPFSFKAIIKHELCHLLLHKNIDREKLPQWLNEGIAQWASDGVIDIVMSNYRALDDAIYSNKFIKIKYLSKTFPKNDKLLTVAYAESKSLVDYMARKYGKERIPELLSHLKNGYDIEDAILKTFSISFEELEKRWYDSIKRRATPLIFLSNHLYEILFFAGALLLIFAFIKIVLKRRDYDSYYEDS